MLEAEPVRPPHPNVEVKISPNTGMPRLEGTEEKNIHLLADLALQSSEYIDPRYIANSAHPDLPGIWAGSVHSAKALPEPSPFAS